MDLLVGRLDGPLEEAAAQALQKRGLIYSPQWRDCPPRIARIDILNLASVNAFLEYVARLTGSKGFKHLPTHSSDVWLPVDIEPTAEPEIADRRLPIPLMRSTLLLKELDEIRLASDLKFGVTPDGYDLMRTNPREFYRSNITLDETRMLQWTWKGLHDAAELSIAKTAPVFAME